MRGRAAILAAFILAVSTGAAAQGPEQIDQLEPGAGEWQAEYFGTFGPGGGREHALEAMIGVTGRLAIGVEVEAEYADGALAFDTAGLKALYRVTGEGSPVGLGVQVQLAFDDRAALVQSEVRLIAAMESESWWAQGNVMLRRASEAGETSLVPAYAVSLQHSLARRAWLGLEGSGRFGPMSGDDAPAGHVFGPSLTYEWQASPGAEIELGLALFLRTGGSGPRNSGRIFIQATF